METTTHEYYVSPEVAELLKKAGFDWLTRYSYDLYLYNTEGEKRVIDGFSSTFYNEHNGLASMPTLEVAQRWLREKWDIIITIEYSYHKNTFICKVYSKSECLSILFDFSVYEEALEAGIKKALEIILEKGEIRL